MFPNKASGEKGVLYNDAVEEALCFEWIDSTIKAYDPWHKIQRFSPRNSRSSYSQANKERLAFLLKNQQIHPKFVDKIKAVLSKPFVFPSEIIDRLREDETVWENYQKFPEGYKRIRMAYIDSPRLILPDEYEKRLAHFIKKTKQNKLIAGFGGIGKFY